MRRRVWREMGTLAGVAVGIACLWLVNDYFGRSNLAGKSIAQVNSIIKDGEKQGKEYIKWPVFQATKGGYRSGATFDEELLPYDGKKVNVVGFQVPIEEFRNMSTFLLLPMPIECYFCQAPPMRDVLLVHMREGDKAPLIKEPVILNGDLTLNKGPQNQFFYTLDNTSWGASSKVWHRKEVPIEHRLPHNRKEEMLPPSEPPKATDAVVDPAANAVTAPVAAPEPAPDATEPVAAAPTEAAPVAVPESAPAPTPAPEATAPPPAGE